MGLQCSPRAEPARPKREPDEVLKVGDEVLLVVKAIHVLPVKG